jgi:type VI secretion system secreted protein VgrG
MPCGIEDFTERGLRVRITQDGRLLAVSTPLGKDVLLLDSFKGTEGLSAPFQYALEMVSLSPEVPFDGILGKAITVRLQQADGGARHFNGIVSRFEQIGTDAEFTLYRAEMVPWLSMLVHTVDSRIFQNQTVPEIIQTVFTDLGYKDFRLNLQATYQPLIYCVQYRESSFNFVSRLMEEYGIFYYFEQEETKHTLVLADNPSTHQVCRGQATAEYETSGGGTAAEDKVISWVKSERVRPDDFETSDYDHEKPSAKLQSRSSGKGRRLIRDHAGRFDQHELGEFLVKVLHQAEEAAANAVNGASTCRGFRSGYKFALRGHSRSDINQEYLLTRVVHEAEQGGFRSGSNDEFSYTNRFACLPVGIPYRAPRRAAKPIAQGSQTAVVVGKEGEEIWVDKYGRVKVQFHWDRLGKRNEHSSCWIRVSQNWAGKNWGGMFIPRIGQEVIVEFLEGDPDHPIITGRVYNAEQPVPYPLPGNQTQSGIRSHSSKDGGVGNCNEIRFEDKKGEEQLFIQAEKDRQVLVKSNNSEQVGANESVSVAGDRTKSVGASETNTIAVDRTTQVGNTDKVEVGVLSQETIGNTKVIGAGNSIVVKAGAAIQIEAGAVISIKCGAASITLMQNGLINISGSIVLVSGTITADVAAPITTVSGLALLQTGAVNISSGVATVLAGVNTKIEGSSEVRIN